MAVSRDYRLDLIEVVLGEHNFEARKALRSTLMGNGLKRINDVGRTDQVRHLLRDRTVDLIIADVDLPEGDFCHICAEIRNQRLGNDPFVPVIAYAAVINSDNIAQITGAGVDHVLQKPVSTADLLARVRHVIDRRKPFVVTQEYIGPDRRNTPRDGVQDKELIDVPNVMKAKVENNAAAVAALTEQRRGALMSVNTQRVRKQAETIARKLELALPMLERPRTEETTDLLNQLLEMTADVRRRLDNTTFGHTASLCQSLAEALFRIQEGGAAGRKDVLLLKPLAQAIVASFQNQRESADAAKKIISMIDSSVKLD